MMRFTAAVAAAAFAFVLAAAPAEFVLSEAAVRIVDAENGKVLEGRMQDGTFTCGDLRIDMTSGPRGNFTLGRLTFSVTGNARRLLEVELSIPHAPTENFYDGNQAFRPGKKAERRTMPDTFPLAAAWDRKRGAAIGIAPTTVASYLYSSLDPASGEFIYRTHVVADSRRQQTVDLLVGNFDPEFGHWQALEHYYDAYPEFFRPHPGVDERIYGVMGYFVSAHKTRDLAINSGRHFALDLEWTYAPFVEAGNWYTDREDWRPGDVCTDHDATRKHRAVTWDEYHAARVKQFESGDRQAAMFHYLLVKSINAEIAQKYDDAISRDETGRLCIPDGMHQLLWEAGKTAAVFPYGSELREPLEREIAQIVANYKVSGFSFDMVNYNLDSYAPSQIEYAVGRDFNRKFQVFTPDTVIPIPFAQYIHTLKRDGKTMGVFANFAFNRMAAHTAFAVDGAMIECPPDIALGGTKTLRVLMGQKPLSFFLGFGIKFHNKAIRWSEVNSPERSREVTEGLAQFMLFNCLRYGYSPMNWNLEYRDRTYFQPYLPLILRLKKAGWRPVSAVRTVPAEVPLWFGRFGKGDETVITITNPDRRPVAAKISLVKKHLGSGGLRPEVLWGDAVRFTDNGDTIDFACTLPPKGILAIGMKDAPRQPRTRVIGDPAAIAEIFTPEDAAAGRVPAVADEPELKVLYDFIDRYYPYVAAARKRTGKPFSREPGFLDPAFNDIWRMPLVGSGTPVPGRRNVIATAGKLPELRADTADLPSGDGLIKLAGETLYLTGDTPAAVRRAVMSYLEILDDVEVKRTSNSK